LYPFQPEVKAVPLNRKHVPMVTQYFYPWVTVLMRWLILWTYIKSKMIYFVILILWVLSNPKRSFKSEKVIFLVQNDYVVL
jgi:hypothetical protein